MDRPRRDRPRHPPQPSALQARIAAISPKQAQSSAPFAQVPHRQNPSSPVAVEIGLFILWAAPQFSRVRSGSAIGPSGPLPYHCRVRPRNDGSGPKFPARHITICRLGRLEVRIPASSALQDACRMTDRLHQPTRRWPLHHQVMPLGQAAHRSILMLPARATLVQRAISDATDLRKFRG